MAKFIDRINKGVNFIIGHPDKIILEKRFFRLLGFIILIGNIYSLILVSYLNLSNIVKLTNAIFIVFTLILYILIRFSKNQYQYVFILFVTCLVFFTSFYIINNGTYGPIIYFYIIIFVFITVIDYKKSLLYMAIMAINLFCLLYYEYSHPEIIMDYDDRKTRLLDIYFVLLFILFFSHLSFKLIMKNHYNEREKVIKQRNEIEKQKKVIEELMQKESRENQMKLNFFTNISHEFRTPLSLIKAPLEKLLASEKNKDELEQLNLALKNTNQLNKLVDQVMDIRKLDSKKMYLELKKTDIIAFVKGISDSFAGIIEKKQLQFQFRSTKNKLPMYFDIEKMERVITNLVSNAVKFTNNGGKVGIAIDIKKGKGNKVGEKRGLNPSNAVLEIKISDTGKGIPEKYLDDIFKPFFQLPDTSYGTGIGLALTNELTKLHNGTILVNSQPGKGSAFIVLLPLNLEKQMPGSILDTEKFIEIDATLKKLPIEDYNFPNEKQSAKETYIANSQIPKGSTKLLIIEDNIDIIKMLENELKGSYGIIKATNGKDGYNSAVKYQPDCIISDIMMPVMDGLELCQKLKSDEQTSHIPVVLLTAKAAMNNKLEGLETGADDYITKPFNMQEVKARVKNLIISRQKLREKYIKEFDHIKPVEIVTNRVDERFINKAVSIVENNMNKPAFGVSEFVSKMGFSRTLIHLKIKNFTNLTTSEFIASIRIKKAIEIVGHGNKSISEACYETGFTDYAYFSKKFKQLFGKSPKKYLKEK